MAKALTERRPRSEQELSRARYEREVTARKTGPVSRQNAAALEGELTRVVRGKVGFDSGSRGLYATDGSNYHQVPIGVVVPRDAEDVIETVAACRRRGVPVLSRGGGTSLAGQCCNVAVVMDMSKYMDRVRRVDPLRQLAHVEPGAILDDLRGEAEKHHLTFGPDPATHAQCTLGGMLGNNSCGVHAVMSGRTSDNVHELDVLTYDGHRMSVGPTSKEDLERIVAAGGRKGEIYARLRDLRDRYAPLVRERFPDIPRRVSGFSLDELLPEKGFNVARALVGSEGTCVTILGATLNLIPSPPYRALVVLGFQDVYAAGDAVPRAMEHDLTGLEGIDEHLFEHTRKHGGHSAGLELFPEGRGWLLAELGGSHPEEAEKKARSFMKAMKKNSPRPAMELYTGNAAQTRVWSVREAALGTTAYSKGEADTHPGWDDSAVPPEKVGSYLKRLRGLFQKYGYNCALYGHFGQGCIHTRIDFDLLTRQGIERYKSFVDEASDLVKELGGSFFGEHGDGQARGELLEKMYGHELVDAFREFKAIWDPDGRMNPGKVVDPYAIDENLKQGSDYNPPQPEVLEAAGWRVVVPHKPVCCGRPLYDYGMLDRARRYLRHVLAELGPWISEGIPLVGLEPSCLAVFRDELRNLLPHDHQARRLVMNARSFAEFLVNDVNFDAPNLNGRALVHGHCHQKAIYKMNPDERLLQKLGLDYQILDAGCCGMAGSFGFEKEKYEVSVACGEQALLPAVRQASKDTMIIADGFSCQEQVRQQTDRRAIHLAQVVQMAVSESQEPGQEPSLYPERQVFQKRPSRKELVAKTGTAVGAGFLLAGLGTAAVRRGRKDAVLQNG